MPCSSKTHRLFKVVLVATYYYFPFYFLLLFFYQKLFVVGFSVAEIPQS